MNYFKDVKCPALRAWNQLSYARELKESRGEDTAEKYLSQLINDEKENVLVIATRIASKGYDETLKEVMNFSK